MAKTRQIVSVLLTTMFLLMAGYETIESCLGKKDYQKFNFTGVTELEEESGASEESKEEKDEEIKVNDDIICEQHFFFAADFTGSNFHRLNSHFLSSDYSSLVYSPPEFI